MKKESNIKKIKVGSILLLAILSFLCMPIFNGNSIYTRTKSVITTRLDYLALSEERQEAYDKMKIEYVNIKNRVTGTAPFNTGNDSDANGVDVSETDEYVRTFDVMKYTVELGISPNTNHAGVTSSSVYEGGVIKVRAKLPNQGSPTLMRWEQDAWMQNVTYSNDKTEIYAEYHVPSGVSVTNANQNLTFTIKVDGFKKEITDDMKPEFEVWMEGNKPDNSSSNANSITQKDTRDIFISGHESFDIVVGAGNYLNIKDQREVNGVEVNGQLLNYAVGVALYQDVSMLSDLRGICYPSTEEFIVKLKMEYSYSNKTANTGWQLITADDPKTEDLINGTKIIEWGLNKEDKPNYYPISNHVKGVDRLPTGRLNLGNKLNSVQNSGTMNLSQDHENISITFQNYTLNGIYPDRGWGHSFAQAAFSRYGYFAVGSFEVFVPYYDDGGASYDYQLAVQAEEASTKSILGNPIELNKGTSTIDDKVTSNNRAIATIKNYLSGSTYGITRSYDENYRTTLDNLYYYGNGSIVLGKEFTMYNIYRMYDGPYEGGADALLAWNAKFFKVKPWNDTLFTYIQSGSVNGYTPTSEENIKYYFGIYKANPSLGITDNTLVNGAIYTDFDWYDSYETALTKGTITAFYVDDPDLEGFTTQRAFGLRFNAIENSDNIGKIGIFRYKWKCYGDENRTQVFYYGGQARYEGNTGYIPTVYNEDGTIKNYESTESYGETIMILGEKASVVTSVNDTDSSNNPKSAYDVQDGEINIKVTPTISNGGTPKDTDSYNDNTVVKTILPNGLSYKNESANKTPESVVVNADGTTTITWEYNNWQINHPAPEYPIINFTANISASLENNQSLEIISTIKSEGDLRDEEQFRTGKYGVVISNLAGSKALKEIDKPVIEKDESFLVTSTLGNNSEEALRNVKTIEILPTDNDENGSKFSGNYTSKVTSGITGQRFFYTTGVISSIGLTEDKYGKLTIKDVDLENDSRWTEINIGDIIPSNATAVATLLPELPSKSEENFVMQFIPAGNKEADVYAFTLNMTSDNLQAAIKTNTVVTQVVSRSLSGKAFIDENRNETYDSEDTLLKTSVVKLLNESGVIVKTTQTNQNGEYTFENIEKGNYYVEFTIPTNYEPIPKGNVSKVYPNGKTDKITELNTVPTTSPTIEATGIDMGIRKIDAKIYVRYEEYGNSTNLFDSTEFDKFYGDSYNLDNDYAPTIPDNYEFKEKTNNYTGTVNQKEINITYYYQKKDSSLTSSITKEGTKEITSREDKVKYKITYKTKITDYLGQATIKITDTLPYEIEEEESELDGGIYDASTKTITWTETKNIQSITEPEITIEKNIEVLYREVDARSREMVNTVEGTTTLENNERSVQDNEKTDIKIPGTIKVRYIEVDEEGKEIKELDTIEDTDLIGEEYTTEEKEFEGYLLKEKPETEEYEFEEEEQIVIYTYEKIKVKVETVVHGLGGKIAGDEDVNYGEDSTKDRIIIEAEEGYQIETIKINNEEQEIKGVVTRLVLDNFEGMTEDKLVEVTFKKTPKIVNPPTGTLLLITLFGIGISIFSFALVAKWRLLAQK